MIAAAIVSGILTLGIPLVVSLALLGAGFFGWTYGIVDVDLVVSGAVVLWILAAATFFAAATSIPRRRSE